MTSNPLSVDLLPAVAATSATPQRSLLEVDADLFRTNVNRQPFLIHHRLADHPLFSLTRLIKLAQTLPADYVEYNAGNIPISIDSRLTPRNGLSVEDTIRRIEDHCSWMVLKRVEQDPEYNDLLNRCLDEIAPLANSLGSGYRMHNRAGAIFISSPKSVTPYHLDHECNFLLQIRGSKSISVFDQTDRSLLSEQELEDYFCSTTLHRNLIFKDEYQRKAAVFDLSAGFALHIPSTAPHWVRNNNAVSISFSVAYQTPMSDKAIALYCLNHDLRQRGWRPTPVGQSPVRDTLKLNAHRALTRTQRTLSALKPHHA